MSAIHDFIEVAEQAFWRGEKDAEFRRLHNCKPGEFFENLPQELKDKFSKMSSDDFKNVRMDAIELLVMPSFTKEVFWDWYRREKRAGRIK